MAGVLVPARHGRRRLLKAGSALLVSFTWRRARHARTRRAFRGAAPPIGSASGRVYLPVGRQVPFVIAGGAVLSLLTIFMLCSPPPWCCWPGGVYAPDAGSATDWNKSV